MSRISEVFRQLKKEKKTALIPYLMAGYPDEATFSSIFEAIGEVGADLVEIGIPWSDPLADGATIQKASEIALSRGMNADKAFRLIKKARSRTGTPVVIMTYYNVIRAYGLDKFASEAAGAGCDGVIVPDLSIEESGPWKAAAGRHGIDTIFLVAPTSSADRRRKIAAVSKGFIYCVSLAGVTGERSDLPQDLPIFMKRVRRETGKPLAVGFGISTGRQAAKVAKMADGVIIGSAILNRIDGTTAPKNQVKAVMDYVADIRAALNA